MKAFRNQRLIRAPREKVFQAFEDPALLAQWWGPAGFSCVFQTFEFKPNGKWIFLMRGPDGAEYPNESFFQEIAKPRRVVVRHDAQPPFSVSVSLKEAEGGTLVEWAQAFDDEETANAIAHIVEPANEQVLDKLAALLG